MDPRPNVTNNKKYQSTNDRRSFQSIHSLLLFSPFKHCHSILSMNQSTRCPSAGGHQRPKGYPNHSILSMNQSTRCPSAGAHQRPKGYPNHSFLCASSAPLQSPKRIATTTLRRASRTPSSLPRLPRPAGLAAFLSTTAVSAPPRRAPP
jgi:hypothetical protein